MRILRSYRRSIGLALSALLLIWQIQQPLSAATVYWDGSASGVWGTAANWNSLADGTGTDVAFANGNDLVFVTSAGATNLTQTLGASRTVRSLTFNSSLTSDLVINNEATSRTLTITPTGTGFTATGVGIDMSGAGANVSIANPITLGADQTWLLGTGRTLTLTGGFTADGTDDLILDGAGTVNLGNTTDNSFSIGFITLQNGATLVNTQDNPFGDTTTVIAMNTGTTWDKGGFTDGFRGLSGAGGSVINAGNLDFRALTGETFTFSGTITAPSGNTAADLIKQGQTNLGTQVIASDVDFKDQLLVYSGTLGLAGVNGAANQAGTTLTSGVAVLLGRSDNATVRDAGVPLSTLLLDSSAANHTAQNRIGDGAEIEFRSGGHLKLIGNASALTTENVGQLDLTESNGIDSHAIVTLQDGGAGLTMTANGLLRSLGATLLVRGDGLGTATAGAGVTNLIFDVTAPTITGTLGTTSVGIIPGVIGDASSSGLGTDLVTHDTNGVRLLTAGEYAATFAGTGENVKLAANQTLAGPLTDLTATLGGAGVTLDLGGSTLTLNNASIVSNGSAAGTISNGTLSFGAATEGFVFTPQDLTLSASITGATSLTKAGAGKLIINAAQTYTGTTSITQGTVDVTGSFFLPATRLNVDNATLNFTGSGTYNRTAFLSGSWNSTVNLNGNTLEMISAGADINYYGQLNGTAASTLIKSGGNVYTQRSLNSSFLGNVIVRGGTFRLVGDTSTSTSPLAGTLTGAASFLVETGGVLSLDNQTGADTRSISDRIGNTTPIALHRGTFSITGSNNARPSETIGNLVLEGAYNTITLDADYGANTASNTSHGDIVVTAASLVRNNFATALVRGDNLGFAIGGTADNTTAANSTGGFAGDPGGSESNLIIAAAPTLSGAGTGAAIGVIPYLTGGVTAGSSGDSLVTVGPSGLRLLDFSPTTTDYTFQAVAANTSLASATISGNNVYVDITANNSDATLDASATVGGFVLDNTGGTGSDLNLNGNTLTIAGGILLSTGSQNNEILAGGTLTFGNNAATGYEGRIHGVRQIDIRALIADNGANPVSITTDGTVYFHNNNTYTGATRINSGRLETGTANALPVTTILNVADGAALRLFGGSQEIGGLTGKGFVENQNTTTNVRTLTINNTSDYTFNGVLRDGSTASLLLTKTGSGTQTLSGLTGSTATGLVSVQNGRLALDGGMTANSGQTFLDNRLAATVPVVLGDGTTSGVLQIGGGSGALNQTISSLSSSGTGTANAIVGGNATNSSLTINQVVDTTFAGNLGGAGTNENNLNLVKTGIGTVTVSGNATYDGPTTVSNGKLVLNGTHDLDGAITVGAASELRIQGAGLLGASSGSTVTVADGGSFILNHGSTNQTFSGTGNVLTLNQSTLTTQLGFGLSGATSDRITLGAGQTLSATGLIDTVIVVGSAPTVLTDRGYLLIDTAADGAFTGTGSFQIGAIENAGNFIYNVAREVTSSGNDQLFLTVTANTTPPPADAWWKGDLTGPAAGSWTAVQLGGASNWDTSEMGGVDAAVPPGANSHVHFSATGAGNFATSLLSPLTIKALTFHAGSGTNGVSIGGIGPLTIGNGVDTPSLDVLTSGNASITISAPVVLGAAQSWNIADAGSNLILSGGISGIGPLSINNNGTAVGTLTLTGATGLATYTGATNLAAGRLVLAGGVNDRLSTTNQLTLGGATVGATLQLGDVTGGATSQTLTDFAPGAATANAIVGGAATASTLTLNQSSNTTYNGTIGGAGTNENNLSLVKNGAGNLILDGAVTYTGTTTINGGTVQLGSTAGSFTGTTGLNITGPAGGLAALDINGRTASINSTTINLGGTDTGSTASILDTAGTGSLTLAATSTTITYNATNNPLGSVIAVDLIGTGGARTFIGNDSTTATTDLTVSGDYVSTSNNSLTLDGTGNNLFSGNITSDSLAETSRDLNKNGTGTWTLSGTINLGDTLSNNVGTLNISGNTRQNDLITTGTGVITNISGVVNGSLIADTASNGIYTRTGATTNILAANAVGSDIDVILVNDNAAGTSTFNINSFDVTIPRLDVGGASNTADRIGNVTGTGTITIGTVVNAYAGSVSANLTSVVTGNAISKDSVGTVVLSGANTLGTSNTLVREGGLTLDFSTNPGIDNKIGTGTLTLGSTIGEASPVLNLVGHATTDSSQSVAAIAAARGASDINLDGNGAALALNVVGTISRTNAATVNFNIEAGTTVNAGTTTLTGDGIIGSWATVNNRSFATTDGSGNIIAMATTAGNDPHTWSVGQHVSNTGNFTDLVDCAPDIASLTLSAAAASTLSIENNRVLTIFSGGILNSPDVGANNNVITGGLLGSSQANNALTVHQNNTAGTLEIASIRVGGDLTKTGNGILTLSGRSIVTTGTVTINEGSLVVTGGNAIGDGADVIVQGSNGASQSNFELAAGQSESIRQLLGGENGNGLVTLNTGSTLTVNGTDGDGTADENLVFGGNITGAGALVKTGNDRINITGVSTHNGTLTINQGGVHANGALGRIASPTIIVNGAGYLISNQDQGSSVTVDRFLNSVAITLNNTNTGSTSTNQGLYHLTNQAAGRTETIGSVTLGAGHNTITANGSVGSAVADLSGTTLTRTNRATVLVRGTSLGTSSATQRGQIRFSTAPAGAVGGSGAAGSTNINIYPWMVGDLTAGGLGNTLVMNTGGTNGLRGLAASEYITDATGFDGLVAATLSNSNMRFATVGAIALTGTATGVNAMVLDGATAIDLTGPANGLELTSGTLLAAGAGNHSISGWTALTTGSTRDYTVYVTTAASSLTINSPLTTAAPLVKAGAGSLVLTSASNTFTDLVLNQGSIVPSSNAVLGSGTLQFMGGGVRLGATYVDDLSAKTWSVGTGGGVIDVSLVTAGTTWVNGIDDATPSAADSLNIVTRSATAGTTGLLTIQGSSTFTGTTIFNQTANTGGTTSVILNGDTNATINGNLQVGNVASGTNDVTVALGADEQIVDTATVSFVSVSGGEAYFKLLGRTETVAGISAVSRGVIENHENTTDTVAANGKLIVNSSQDFSYTGFLRDRQTGTGGTLAFEKQGTGTQTLVGANVLYTGPTTITGGTLRLTDTTAFNSDITNNATLDLNRTTGSWTLAKVISGTGAVNKLGTGTVVLSGANSYSGQTNIEQGILSISASANLGDASATNTIRIANNATLQSTGADVDLGANRGIAMTGLGATIEVTGTNKLTAPGVITDNGCQLLTKTGSGALSLTGASTYEGGTSVVAGTLDVSNTTGSGTGLGTLTVDAGTILTGGGIISPASGKNIVIDGVLAPGALGSATGTDLAINLTGASTLSINSELNFTLFGNDNLGTLNPLTQNSSLVVSAPNWSSLTIGSGAVLNVGLNTGVTTTGWSAGDAFKLFDWLGILAGTPPSSGTAFSAINLPALDGGKTWDTSQIFTTGQITITPEPGRALLLMLGLLGLAFRRRR